MTTSPLSSWVYRSLLCGQTVNGEISLLSGVERAMADHLNRVPLGDRRAAFDVMAAIQPDPNELLQAVLDADISQPAPPAPPSTLAGWGPIGVLDLPPVETFPIKVL